MRQWFQYRDIPIYQAGIKTLAPDACLARGFPEIDIIDYQLCVAESSKNATKIGYIEVASQAEADEIMDGLTLWSAKKITTQDASKVFRKLTGIPASVSRDGKRIAFKARQGDREV